MEESRGDKTENIKTFTLTVYAKHNRDFNYLLEAHNSLMKAYYEKARLSLNTKPHIFELTGMDEETGALTWDMHEFSSTRQLKHVWFRQKKAFMQAYENFLDHQDQYEHRGDPYTFSCLLYGTPGCGKTSLLKALVNHSIKRGLMTHVFVINFAKIKNAPMLSKVIFNKDVNGHYIPFNQRMIIFEDFDADASAKVFKKRFKDKDASGADGLPIPALVRGESNPNVRANELKAAAAEKAKKAKENGEKLSDDLIASLSLSGPDMKKKEDALSLSAVLNVLDGINERTGQRCFWTTNAAPPEEHFDAAFLRPGRMDMMIDFTKCNQEGIGYLLQAYYGDDETVDANLLSEVDDFKWSPAEVKQKCKESPCLHGALEVLAYSSPTQHV